MNRIIIYILYGLNCLEFKSANFFKVTVKIKNKIMLLKLVDIICSIYFLNFNNVAKKYRTFNHIHIQSKNPVACWCF